MTFQKHLFSEYNELRRPSKIYLGDNRVISTIGEGKVKLMCYDGTNSYVLSLQKVLFVPELTKNLLSVPVESGAEVIFDEEKCMMSKDKQTFTIGRVLNDKLFKVNTVESANIASSAKPDMIVWHCRFGHMNSNYLERLIKNELVDGLELNYSNGSFEQNCEACALGKMSRYSFPKKSQSRTSRPLELIHSDICGPMNVDSIGGSKCMQTFTDDFTRYVTAYFIKSKAEVLSKLKEYLSMMKNKTGSHVESLRIAQEDKVSAQKRRSDNGGEYTSCEFARFCKERGIPQEFSDPYTPEQNGVSERLNRTLIEKAKGQ